MARTNGIMGPWETYRKIGLFLSVAVCVFLFVILYVPVGFVAVGIMIAASSVWKPVGMVADPTLGTYTMNTLPFKFAAFFTALKAKRPEVLTLNIMFGFGPPGPDRDHGLEPGWLPPTRLSAYWSLLCALVLGALDILLIKAHLFIIPGIELPWFIVYPVSVAGFLAFFQIIVAIKRIQGDSTTVVGTEPKPAVMIHKSRAEIPFMNLAPRALIISGAPVVILILVAIMAKWPIWIMLAGAPVLLLLGSLIVASSMMATKYIEAWAERTARREYWMGVFSFKRDLNPILVDEVELPTAEEFDDTEARRVAKLNRRKQEGEEPEVARMYEPQIKVAIFQFPPNAIFIDYVGLESRIKGLLGVEMCAISPIGNVSQGAEVRGTIGSNGFRVWWSEQDPKSFLDDNIDDWMREFLVRAKIIPALASIRAIGYCSLFTCGMITRTDSEKKLIEVKIVPPTDTTLENFLNNIEQIRTTLDVPWVRIGKLDKSEGAANLVSLFIGDFPEMSKTKFVNPQSIVRRQIDKMDWSYYFNATGIKGINGLPEMVERRPSTDIVDKIVFKLPDGMSYETIPNKKSPLMSTSGYLFMEIDQGDEDATKRMSEEEKIINEARQESRFTLIASKQDPLKRVFNFGDYKDKILFPRTPGKERINWFGGVMADDSLAEYSWDSEEPHLLIAGSSGSGKALDIDTDIYTIHGWQKMGDLRVGEGLFDINGDVTRIIHAFDEYTPEFAYDMTFDDGEVIRSSGNHPWSVTEAYNRYTLTREVLDETSKFAKLTHPHLAQIILNLRKLGNDLGQADQVQSTLSHWNDTSAHFVDNEGKVKSVNGWQQIANATPKRHLYEKRASTKISSSQIVLNPSDRAMAHILEVEAAAFSQPRYDSMGVRVLSLAELAKIASVDVSVLEMLVMEIDVMPSAKWHYPVTSINEETLGIILEMSEETDLYSPDLILRHLANAYAEREIDIELVSKELIVLNTAEIADSFLGEIKKDDFHYSIPFRPIGDPTVYMTGIGGVTNPFSGQHNHLGSRYIVGVKQIEEAEIPRMRCVSVDSPTKTYRAGKGLIPTHNSVVSSSMILQLAHNNGPTEAVIWAVEPKTEMQIYRNLDVIERFVDSWSPDDQFMMNAADLMEDAVAEMEKRNKAFIAHPKQPKNLKKAREIAVRESEMHNTPLADHPLYIPFMFIILEECATLFADAASKEEKQEQGRLLGHTAEIARKARSAGIYLIALTQYPTNASIPSVIRNQMRRIGLKCQNDMASRIVIGENGLEKIKTKGVGMLSVNGTYRAFRGFWVKDGDPDNNEANDILTTIAGIPTKGSMVIGSGGQSYPEIFIPEPSSMVFNAWDSIVGARLASAIDDLKNTKDVSDKDLPSK